jgi:hypothetical protein
MATTKRAMHRAIIRTVRRVTRLTATSAARPQRRSPAP